MASMARAAQVHGVAKPVLGRGLPQVRAFAAPAQVTDGEQRRVPPAGFSFAKLSIQPKLPVSQPGDALEQEADRVADRVMRMPDPAATVGVLQRQCATCEEEEGEQVQRKADGGAIEERAVPPIVHEVLRTPGQPLDAATRGFMEPRFGHSFGHVRVYADGQAAAAAAGVGALAFATGQDVVFGAGQYAPHTLAGQKLLAHELAHVVQQSAPGSSAAPAVQRQEMPGPPPPLDLPDTRDPHVTSAPGAHAWAGPPGCGPSFCQPWATQRLAEDDRTSLAPLLLAGIAAAVSPRVVSLWRDYMFGGSAPRSLNGSFATDFTSSPTTARTTTFLMGELRAALSASAPVVASGATTTLDIPTLIPAAVAQIDDPTSANPMNFDIPGDIPGNLAGGLGKDEAANPVGAMPSPFNDERHALGTVTLTDGPAGSLLVTPALRYRVQDTIDLCPGDCGAPAEQVATIPMSRWEATGISGDVPFTVDFPAVTAPFTVPRGLGPPPPPPPPGPSPSPKP
jgi:Domain of unknown function (DUF4157)